jgi:hypothetical protein
VVRGVKLDALWQVLREAPAGRILFLRSGVRLDYHPEWWRPHSHISALTPVVTGREIINGTFTHPSPIAGLLYTGSAHPRPITTLAEERDGVSLFGQPLESLTAADFRARAEQLGISAVVASEEDVTRLGFLESDAGFAPPRVIGAFRVYLARAPHPLPEPAGPQTWRLALARGPQSWRAVGLAYSPLWTADSDGKPLSTRRDPIGMLEVEVPAGAGSIMVHHRPGAAERSGLLISILSIAALLIAAVGRAARAQRSGPMVWL